MKWLITSVQMSALTRRRQGKSQTEVFDTDEQLDPVGAEIAYERQKNVQLVEAGSIIKVIDVREAR